MYHRWGFLLYSDYATIKYNDTGDTQWVAIYDGPAHDSDQAWGIVLDEIGNVYVTGGSTGEFFSDVVTIKYNSDGVQQWIAIYNGPGNKADYAKAIVMDQLGNVYVTGSSKGDENQDDFVTIKYNNDGVEQWVARYSGPVSENLSEDIAIDTAGNVYVTGSSRGVDADRDYATVMYSPDGIEQWVARYDGPANAADYPTGIVLDNLGNTYVTGYSYALGTGRDCTTIKYNSVGEQEWIQRYNSPWNDDDYSYAISIDLNSNVYITGCTKTNICNRDYLTIKYDSAGNEQWVQTYDGFSTDSWDNSEDIVVDSLGNSYVTGFSNDFYVCNFVTIKYNATGVEEWVTRFETSEAIGSRGRAVTLDDVGNVYVTGDSYTIGTDYNFATIKYTPDVDIDSSQFDELNAESVLQIIPNPSYGAFIVKYSIPDYSEVHLGIYDLSGRHISTLADCQKDSGEHSTLFTGIPTGVYLSRLQVGSESLTKKFVVLQ